MLVTATENAVGFPLVLKVCTTLTVPFALEPVCVVPVTPNPPVPVPSPELVHVELSGIVTVPLNVGEVKVGEVEKTRLVDVVPVVPPALNPVILLKQVIEALLQFVPPLATVRATPRVNAGVIVTAPVETEPMPMVPLPLALNVRLVLLPLSIAAIATVPPVAAPVTFKPAACEAVEALTLKAGLVAPLRPTASTLADADVIVWAVVEIVLLVTIVPKPEAIVPDASAPVPVMLLKVPAVR